MATHPSDPRGAPASAPSAADPPTIALTAYADRLSVRPGETISFHVSHAASPSAAASASASADSSSSDPGPPPHSPAPDRVHAEIARVISADANPSGPGVVLEPVTGDAASGLRKLREPTFHDVPRGSYGRIDGVGAALTGGGGGRWYGSFSFVCRLMPTLLPGGRGGGGGSAGEQAVASLLDPPDGGGRSPRGFSLSIDGGGRLCGHVSEGGGRFVEASTDRPLEEREWHAAFLGWDSGRGELTVGHAPIRPAVGARAEPSVAGATIDGEGDASAPPPPPPDAPLLLAARDHERPTSHFNGRLERPMLFDRALSCDEAASATFDSPGLIGGWDLSRSVETSAIEDVGPNGLGGFLVNCPARAVTGSDWDGTEMCWRSAPRHYGAVHFHEDDVSDCLWPVAFEWEVPTGTRSAVYALLLEAGGERENVPFHVVPPRGASTADVAVLASTFTYVVYGNHARPEYLSDPLWREAWHEQAERWGCYPHNPGMHRQYGLSTYNEHPDGSGISVASWRRPMLNVRVGYLTFPGESERASGLRHFPADTHLIGWLENKGYAYDVVTDWELHHEGAELLSRYRAVLTGTHPEYHTRPTLDAIRSYRDSGGRFCYLGGNGFYWKVALSPDRDGLIEIRRAEGGIRAWASEPGEYYNQFDGEYGGLWRRNGRPPQDLVGVGFTAQGNFVGSYYRRTPESRGDPRVSWMFDGIESDKFGDHGLSGHGAAGFELDRADRALGTPRHALVVASSEGHPPDAPWVLVPEEVLTHLTTLSGDPATDLIRSDVAFFETPGGGAVFSVGSITFCGSLVTDGYDNDVSTLLGNVMRRFLDPRAFRDAGAGLNRGWGREGS